MTIFFFFWQILKMLLATNKIWENLNRCQNKFPLKFPIQARFAYSLIWIAPGLLRKIFRFKGKKPNTNTDNILMENQPYSKRLFAFCSRGAEKRAQRRGILAIQPKQILEKRQVQLDHIKLDQCQKNSSLFQETYEWHVSQQLQNV